MTMKKAILPAMISALLATSAQAANVYDVDGTTADVYGRMQFDISDNGSDTDGVGSARMGFKGKSVINADVSAIAKGEWQISAEDADSSKFTARHLYAGFESADYGTVVFGQSDTAFYQAVAATDIFNTYGYEAFSFIEDGRQEGQIIYNGNFAGVYVGASYQFRNEDFEFQLGNPEDPTYVDIDAGTLDKGYALTLGYDFDFGLGVYAGYHVEEFENVTKDNYALSAAYSLNDLYLAAAFVSTDVDGNELTGYDIVASYAIDATTLYTGYAVQDAKDGWEEAFGTDTPADAFKLGAAYSFNNNLQAWAEYLVDNTDGADDQWTVAIQYNF